ncbi:PAS domain S-box-containing protein [Sphingomonas sp. SORGH_AS 950]|uniref:ATP-binding protein n=1 Tax=Sphingomonas sp. SORGH_AS_0950 TaxID=3041792 RepID=UPI00278980FE|nr:ATP-binding protein [Sphingomonas sp. SORGH_AS_0950]MDQ1156250.1 PAS domain S-box-containing protein [Sphingomonas sp. SORGH_AS_0950]
MTAAQPDPDLAFLDGGGEATRLILARDWTDHPLGPPRNWPETLRVALSLVLNSPESMILAWGPELHFFFNETYFPLLGPRLPWAMGARFDEVWADALEQARPIIDDALAGRTQRFVDLPWKLDTDRGEAHTFWSFSYSRVLDGRGDVAGLFIFTNETTARVHADAALRDSQLQLSQALEELRGLNVTLEQRIIERTAERDRMWDVSPDLLAVLNAEGVIQRTNPAWGKLLGYGGQALVGRSVMELVHPDDLAGAQEALSNSLTRQVSRIEVRMRHAQGDYEWIAWVGASSAREVFAVGRHITQQKAAEEALRQTEEQLRQAQKLEAIGQLTGSVAHDFNNLLTVIRGSIDLIRRPGFPPERRQRQIEAIADAADRAAKLTAQLLAFARRQPLTPEVVDVGASIMTLSEMIATLSGPGIRLVFDLPDRPCHAHVDRSQFDTAIVNMAVNARDAMAGQGTLTIRVWSEAEPQGADQVRIAIIDTGEGIPADRLDQIFEPFFTTKRLGAGTGLGLSQVFGFARQSGGDVHVASTPGQGATFTLVLPRTDGLPAADRQQGDPRAANGTERCVLVVEDNVEVGQFAVEALQTLGYRTVIATNAAAAMEELKAGAERFDLVFSDVMMPGQSGIDFAHDIARLHPELRILLTSGYSRVIADEGSHGFALLRKPYTLAELAQQIDRLFGV